MPALLMMAIGTAELFLERKGWRIADPEDFVADCRGIRPLRSLGLGSLVRGWRKNHVECNDGGVGLRWRVPQGQMQFVYSAAAAAVAPRAAQARQLQQRRRLPSRSAAAAALAFKKKCNGGCSGKSSGCNGGCCSSALQWLHQQLRSQLPHCGDWCPASDGWCRRPG